MSVSSATPTPPPTRHAVNTFLDRLPYWLLVAMLLGVLMLWRIFTDETYTAIFNYVARGVVVTESVYSIPGLGRLTVDAVLARDFPTVQAVVLPVSLVYVLLNLLVAVAYTVLDPRIRY